MFILPPTLPAAKKESAFDNLYRLRDEAYRFRRRFPVGSRKALSLVHVGMITKSFYVQNTEWSRLDEITRMFYISLFVAEKNYKAISVRFSYDFIQRAEGHESDVGYIRRRLSENLKTAFGYIPRYAFILEGKGNGLHLHGIMDIDNGALEKVRRIVKRTFFGRDYKNSPMEKNIVCIKIITDALYWIAYCLKRKVAKNKLPRMYVSRELNALARIKYNHVKGSFIGKPLFDSPGALQSKMDEVSRCECTRSLFFCRAMGD